MSSLMSRCAATLLALMMNSSAGMAGDLIDSMDTNRFRIPKEKGRAELVEGKVGKVVRFSFEKDCQNTFFASNIGGKPEWDRAPGISLWVKGDGSDSFGGLQLIFHEDYAVRYDLCFPIRSKNWIMINVAWRNFKPVLPGSVSRPLGLPGGNAPSKISALWIGKWWYWRDYPAGSFAIYEIRLEEKIEQDVRDYRPEGNSLGRVLARLKAGKPVPIVTVDDSLTDTRHWANREASWPLLMKKELETKYGSKVTIVNPAIGGTQLRQNRVLMPRWLAQAAEPDLVTFCFGFNDWDSGMRGQQFHDSYEDAVDRVRRATKGKADVLILTTLPAVERWTTMAELAEACRAAARSRNAGLADTEKAFLEGGKENREKLYVRDRTHLGPVGHDLMAKTVLNTIERGDR